MFQAFSKALSQANLPYLWLSLPPSAVAAADYVIPGTRQKLSHPTNAAHKITAVNEEQDHGRVTRTVLPVNEESKLQEKRNNLVALYLHLKHYFILKFHVYFDYGVI